MLIVMPRAFSSGALSIWSYALNSANPIICDTFVIAAVNVVFPWSMCPIVPTFKCGLLRSYFAFAIDESPYNNEKQFVFIISIFPVQRFVRPAHSDQIPY